MSFSDVYVPTYLHLIFLLSLSMPFSRVHVFYLIFGNVKDSFSARLVLRMIRFRAVQF